MRNAVIHKGNTAPCPLSAFDDNGDLDNQLSLTIAFLLYFGFDFER